MTSALSAAEAMDRMYRHQRYIYDLTRKHYLLGRDELIRRLRPAPGETVLEVGCGTARNLIVAAKLYPQARLFGVDVSNEMLAFANEQLRRDGLTGRVSLARGSAEDFDPAALFGVAAFDRVFVSYSLSMIPRWREALDHALALVAPGGRLAVVDFGDQERLPKPFRAVLRRWLALFDVTPRGDLEAALRDAAARHGAALTVTRPYLGYAQLAVLTAPRRAA